MGPATCLPSFATAGTVKEMINGDGVDDPGEDPNRLLNSYCVPCSIGQFCTGKDGEAARLAWSDGGGAGGGSVMGEGQQGPVAWGQASTERVLAASSRPVLPVGALALQALCPASPPSRPCSRE